MIAKGLNAWGGRLGSLVAISAAFSFAIGCTPDHSSDATTPAEPTAPTVMAPPTSPQPLVESQPEPTAAAPVATPSLVPMMRELGYTSAEEIDLAEFVHAPPAAHAEAGSFGNGAQQVRVALVIYPNDRYAAPHFNDVRERLAVVPELGEAVLMHDTAVIHIRAVDRQTALQTRDALASALSWAVEDD